MLSQVDKFLIVFLMFAGAFETGVDALKAVADSNWLWALVSVGACVYTAWLGFALIKHFFPVSVLPAK